MFESNFPVDRAGGAYTLLWNSFQRIVADFSDDEKAALFRDTGPSRLPPRSLNRSFVRASSCHDWRRRSTRCAACSPTRASHPSCMATATSGAARSLPSSRPGRTNCPSPGTSGTLKATDTHAGALVVPAATTRLAAHQIVVDDPFAAFVVVLRHIDRERRREDASVHPSAVVAESASVGTDVSIGAGVTVRDGAAVGDRTVLHANACVGPRSRVGSDCVLFPRRRRHGGRDDRRPRRRPRRHGHRLRRLRLPPARRPARQDPAGRDGHDRRRRGDWLPGHDRPRGARRDGDRPRLEARRPGPHRPQHDRRRALPDPAPWPRPRAAPGSATASSWPEAPAPRTVWSSATARCSAATRSATATCRPAPSCTAIRPRPKSRQLRIEAVLNRLPQMERDLRALLRRMEGRSETE